MKKKHLLMAMSLPVFFAACTSDEFENQNAGMDNLNRPTIGDVSLVLGEVAPATRLQDPFESNKFNWGSATLGACLMDVANGSGTDFASKYSLSNTVATDYPFTYNADKNVWETTGLLLEGNYFFYYPAKEAGMNRSKFTYSIAEEQVAHNNGANKFQAVTDNQLYISYLGLEKNTVLNGKEIPLSMAPAHKQLNFIVNYDGENNINIYKVALEPVNGNGFAVEGYLDVEENTSAAKYPIWLYDGDGNKTEIKETEGTYSLREMYGYYNDADIFDKWGGVPTYNPLNVSKALKVNGTDYAEAIFVKLGNEKGFAFDEETKSVSFAMIVPNHSATSYTVKIYTDKGIVTYPSVGTHSYKEGSKNDIVVFAEADYDTKEDEDATVAVASAKLWDGKEAEEGDGYAPVMTDLKSLTAQDAHGLVLNFSNKAIKVSPDFDVKTTNDLELYLSYHDFQNYQIGKDEEPVAITATLKGAGIELTKKAYQILADNAGKFRLTVKEDDAANNRTLTIAGDVKANDALYMLDWNDVDAVIASGTSQLINADFVPAVKNLGTLEIAQYATNGDGSEYEVVTTTGNIVNEGTLTVTTSLKANVTVGRNGTSANVGEATVNAVVKGTITNYSKLTVNTYSVTKIENKSKSYRSGKYTNTAHNAEVTVNGANNNEVVQFTGMLENNAIVEVNAAKATFSELINKKNLTLNNETVISKLTNTGTIDIADRKVITINGTSTSSGTINNKGNMKIGGTFTNTGIFNNDYGLVSQTGATFANNETLNAAAASFATYITSNAGTINIENRAESLKIGDGTANQGTIAYIATEDDLTGDVFVTLNDDKFNKLTINKNGIDLTELNNVKAENATVVTALVLNADADCKYKFVDDAKFEKLTVGSGSIIVEFNAKNLTVSKNLTIENGTTLHIPDGKSMTFEGSTVDNGGYLLVGGSFTATTMSEPSDKTRYEETGGSIIWANSAAAEH